MANGSRSQRARRMWASGSTRVYAEGALARAHALDADTAAAELLDALREIVEALDRGIPYVERARKAEMAEAKRLRAAAVERQL